MNNLGQAKLYYLYMMADGSVSNNEDKLFDTICNELNLDNDTKNNIKQECYEIYGKRNLTCIDVVRKNAEEDFLFGQLDINLNQFVSDSDKTRIIWNLVNLGYADSQFTANEKIVVDYLQNYWSLSESVYNEIIDVAETCLSIETYKIWINKLPDSDYKTQKLKQIEKDLYFTQRSILTIIYEMVS